MSEKERYPWWESASNNAYCPNCEKHKEIITTLRTRIEELELAQQWQPIATAPTKGRDFILLLAPSRYPQVAYSNTWWTAGFSVENKPTHWMPLRKPPEDKCKHGKGLTDFCEPCGRINGG